VSFMTEGGGDPGKSWGEKKGSSGKRRSIKKPRRVKKRNLKKEGGTLIEKERPRQCSLREKKGKKE